MAVDPERHTLTVAALQHSPFHAFVCNAPTEVLLLTGYWPIMGASVAVFDLDGQVTVVVPEDEAELASKTTSARIVCYKPDGLHTLRTALAQLRDPLRSVLSTCSLAKATIGLQVAEGIQPSTYAVSNVFRASLLGLLQELQPDASFKGCDELLETMKAVKTAKELEVMQTATNLAAIGFAEAAASIQPGLREIEVAAKAHSAFAAMTAENIERSYGYFYCMSGPNSAKADAAYARTRNRVIEEGDLVMVHANTCADGYWTDLTRTYIAGQPSDKQWDIRHAIDEARATGLRSVRPSSTGQQVDHAVRSVMEFHGFGKAFTHSTGHGVGFAAANPNGRPRIHPLSPDVLEKGMTFNLEPAAYFDGYGGMRHCDVIVVTADGAKVLSDF